MPPAIGSSGAYVTISRTIGAGKTDIVDASGSYVACLASTLAGFLISLDGQGSAFFAKGLKIKAPFGQVFKNLIVDNSQNAQALTYTLAVGVGDITDGRTTLPPAGDVLDTFALAGQCFTLRWATAAGAAQFASNMLFNSVSSITGYVRRIKITSSIADNVLISTATASSGGVLNNPSNKLPGGNASSVTPGSDINAAQNHLANTGLGISMDTVALAANVMFSYEPKGPLVIPLTKGWGVWAGAANTTLTTTFEWDEH